MYIVRRGGGISFQRDGVPVLALGRLAEDQLCSYPPPPIERSLNIGYGGT